MSILDSNPIPRLDTLHTDLAALLTELLLHARKTDTQPVSVSNFPSTQAVSVSNFPGTQPISGTTSRAAQSVSTDVVTIAASGSLSGSVTLAGRTLLRIVMPAAWTTAVLTLQTSEDNVTFNDLYDEYGNVYTIQAAASRSILLSNYPLIGSSYLKIRSGIPSTPVTQAASAALTLVSQTL